MLLCAALLGLVNELVGGSLIAPSGLELRPTAATMQWAELVGSQEVLPQAWACIGISVSQQVKDQVRTHSQVTDWSCLVSCQLFYGMLTGLLVRIGLMAND